MDVKINLDKILLDVTSADKTVVTLLYSSDEPANPLWGGGVKRKDFPASVPTGQLIDRILGETGADYIHWPDAAPETAAWLIQHPGAPAFTDWARFDSTPPEMAGVVARARNLFGTGRSASAHEYLVLVPEPGPRGTNGPGYLVTFRRHDALAPWVAICID